MLKVIGAGLGRTGTHSLGRALEKLGFGPCYNILEVRKNPGHAVIWNNAMDRKAVDGVRQGTEQKRDISIENDK